MRLLKIWLTALALMIIPATSFADMPEISAGQTYFDVMKGYYVLKDNVHVKMKNHGVTATITASEARVNVISQKCWALGKVNFSHEDYNVKCNNAFMRWDTKTAELVGNIDFEGKKSIKVKSATAVFNWDTKEADFYGEVEVKATKDLQFAEGLKLDGKVKKYAHVKYNVTENKILQLDKTFDLPKIEIPDPDK